MNRHHPKTLSLAAISGIYIIAQVIIVPVLPELSLVFSTDYKTIQLSIGAFLLGAALVNLIAGPLSDRYGRRPIAFIFFIIFICASLASFFVENIYLFIFLRFLQASCAAGMVLARAIVGDIYSGKQATIMFGYISMIMAIGPLVGPFLGGLISDVLGPLQVLVFLALLGVVVLYLIITDLQETNLTKSESILAQLKSYPLLLKSNKFWPPTLVSSFSFSVFGIFFVGGPYIASSIYEMSASQIGVYFSFPPLGFIIGNFLAGKFSDDLSTKSFLFLGSCILTSAPIALFTLSNIYEHQLAFFGPIILMTLGAGIIWPVANTAIVKAVPPLAGSASGLSSALMVIVSALASAIVGFSLELGNPILKLTVVLVVVGLITIFCSLFTEKEAD